MLKVYLLGLHKNHFILCIFIYLSVSKNMEPIPDQPINKSEAPAILENTAVTINADVNCYTNQTIQSLSGGLVELYKPNLVKVKEQLKELTTKQTVLVEQLHNENLKLSWSHNSTELQEMFNTIKIYHNKLLNIKKDMRSLHERSTKLKKRAARLQQYKEKETYMKNQQVKQEQDLVAKPNSSGS